MSNGYEHDICVCMPTHRGEVHHETKQCLNDCIKYLNEQGLKVAASEVMGSNICRNRNSLVETAVNEAKAKWLMFIDNDMMFEKDAVSRLIARDVWISSGLCVGKKPPHGPSASMWNSETKYYETVWYYKHDGRLMPVDAVGTGFMLIKTCIFKELSKPYFAMPPLGERVNGEDYYFCEQARMLGILAHVDGSLQIGHLGFKEGEKTLYPYTYADTLEYRDKKIN